MEDQLQTAIVALERAIQTRKDELAGMERSLAQLRGAAPTYTKLPASDEWAALGITEAAHRWLTEIGEARGTREIADAIRDRGVRTQSRNYTATVYATLKNAKTKFARKEGLWSALAKKR